MFALAASVGLKARPPVKINHPCKARDLHRLPGCGEGRLVRWLVAPLHLRWSFGSKQMLPKHFTKIWWESIACDRYKGSPIVISVFFCLVKFECGRILRRHFFWHFFFGDLWPKTGLKDLNWNNKNLHQPWQQRKVQSSGDKASEIWTAYGSLEELLEGMEQRYLELCQANDTEDEPLGERTNIKCLGQKSWGGMRWVRFQVYKCFW